MTKPLHNIALMQVEISDWQEEILEENQAHKLYLSRAAYCRCFLLSCLVDSLHNDVASIQLKLSDGKKRKEFQKNY